MNIYTFLMSKEKNDLSFPKISSSKHTKQKVSAQKIMKEARNLSNEQYKYRKTYNDILKSGLTVYKQKPKKEITKQILEFKKTMNTTFLRGNIQSKNEDKIPGFQIIAQLGKGGFADVVQARGADDCFYAVKKYMLDTSVNCYQNQIAVGQHFFLLGKLRQNFAEVRGGNNLIGFVKKLRTGKKGYIVQEIGGKNLSKLLLDIQGTFHKGQRVYEVLFSDFYEKLAKENLLQELLLQIIYGVQLLNNEGYLHCDLKPENILVDFFANTSVIKCKIIDFGSSFKKGVEIPKITITPQYMPPQLLETIQYDKNQANLGKVDIWSFGCIVLQIVTGIPLWFRYKCKLTVKNRQFLQLGYFALTNREYPKIMKKQREICKSLDKIKFIHPQFEKYRKILKRTLVIDVQNRATHQQIINMLQDFAKI